jgi:hypothetical protein
MQIVNELGGQTEIRFFILSAMSASNARGSLKLNSND